MPRLWGEHDRITSANLSPPAPSSGLLQQRLTILNSLWMLKKACPGWCACYLSSVQPTTSVESGQMFVGTKLQLCEEITFTVIGACLSSVERLTKDLQKWKEEIKDWLHKGELFLPQCAHDISGHQGRDETYWWTHAWGVDLTMDTVSLVLWWHGRENWVRQGYYLKNSLMTAGPESRILSGYIIFPVVHQPLGKLNSTACSKLNASNYWLLIVHLLWEVVSVTFSRFGVMAMF